MIGFRASRGVCLVLAAAASSAANAEAPETYSLAAIEFTVEERELVGRKRAGLICLPNGSIRFSDVNLPAAASLRSAAARGFARTIDIAPAESAVFNDAQSPYRIVGTVTGIELSLCAPKWGLGDRTAVKGSADVVVRWDVYSRATRAIELTATLTGQAKTTVATDGMAALIAQAIVASAETFAADPALTRQR